VVDDASRADKAAVRLPYEQYSRLRDRNTTTSVKKQQQQQQQQALSS
jgi:hypothetical protein